MFSGQPVLPRLAASFFGLTCALAASAPAVARAAEAPQLLVSAVGACPSVEEVISELRELMPDATLDASADAEGDVRVVDHVDTFSVQVRGQRRRFRDQKRDCTERARHVAVVTVLVVDPLHVPNHVVSSAEEEPEPAEKPPEPRPAPPPPPAPPPAKRASFDLSLGPLAQVAIHSDAESSTQAGGLGLRLRYGSAIGVTLGVAGLLPTSLHFAEADARATWLPMDLGLSLARRTGDWEASAELGAVAALLFVEGQALDATQQATRVELGGRLGVQVRYWASERAGIYAGMSGTWFPKPYSLEVQGVGVVGETPSGWIGGSLGAVLRL